MKHTILALALFMASPVIAQQPIMGDEPNLSHVPQYPYGRVFPQRGDKPVPVLELSQRMQGGFIDREVLDRWADPTPDIMPGEEHLWLKGLPFVVDGDSFSIDNRLVRLAGIDAPEVDQLCYRGNIAMRCGIDSRAWLAAQIEDRQIVCKIHYTDAAQRDISTCWSAGREVNGLSISQGQSVAWVGAPTPYQGMEEEARHAQMGMWQTDFRHPAEWREIMKDTRDTIDAKIANGTHSAGKPFPYVPFNQLGEPQRNIPIFDATR